MHNTEWFDSKTPAEIVPIGFEFIHIVSEISAIESIAIEVINGIDPDVNTMLYGAPSLSGTTVTQLLRNGVDGVTYRIIVTVTRNLEKYQLSGYMKIKTLP